MRWIMKVFLKLLKRHIQIAPMYEEFMGTWEDNLYIIYIFIQPLFVIWFCLHHYYFFVLVVTFISITFSFINLCHLQLLMLAKCYGPAIISLHMVLGFAASHTTPMTIIPSKLASSLISTTFLIASTSIPWSSLIAWSEGARRRIKPSRLKWSRAAFRRPRHPTAGSQRLVN